MAIKLLKFTLLAFVCLPLMGMKRPARAILKNDIERIIYRHDQAATIGIDIVNLRTGEHIYQHNSHQRLIPGGCVKLFTLAAAYELLGLDHCFKTTVYADSPIEHGAVCGNIYLKGSGDPTLQSAHLSELVHQLHILGIEEIKGKLVVDATNFDTMASGPGWAIEDTAPKISVPSALSINQSLCNLWIRPGNKDASPPIIISDLPLNQLNIKIDNQALTLAKPKQSNIDILTDQREHSATLHIMGQLKINGAPLQKKIPISNPPLMVGMTMQSLMHDESITLRGELVEGVTPPGLSPIAHSTSMPLSFIGQQMCKESNDYYAHCLLKTLGEQDKGPPGTWQTGGNVIRRFAAQYLKMNPKELSLLDGSGLSRFNLLAPSQMTQCLAWAYHHPCFSHEILSALSIAGVDGTLKDRLTNLNHKGKIRGLSGSIKGVSSFTGICWDQAHDPIAVTIIINNSSLSEKELDREIIDPICALIVLQ